MPSLSSLTSRPRRAVPAAAFTAIVLALSLSTMGLAQAAPTPPSPGSSPNKLSHSGFTVAPPTDPYLMAFHTCVLGANCEDPTNHLVHLASSPNGVNWTQLPGWQTYEGSVPDVIRRGNTILVSNPLSSIDVTTGKVTPQLISVVDAQGADAMPRDLSFAGQLPDGRIVVVYVPSMQAIDMNSNERAILLATEVAGSGGTKFISSGTAITINKSTLPAIGEPTDPDIFYNGSRWVLYVSLGSNLVAYTSASLTGPYEQSTQTLVSSQTGGVGTGMTSTDGSTVFSYVNNGPDRNNQSVFFAQTSLTPVLIPGASWQAVLTPGMFGTATAESPGVAQNVPGISCGAGCAGSSTSTTSVPAGKPGSRCTTTGVKGTYRGTAMVCKKVKGKFVWTRVGSRANNKELGLVK